MVETEKKKWEKSPQSLIDRFYAVMAPFPEADLKKMFGYPCAFFNGNMFVGLHQRNLIIRLPQKDRELAIEKGLGSTFEPMPGRVMKEYLSVSDAVIEDPSQLHTFLSLSMDYVKTLPKKEKKSRKK